MLKNNNKEDGVDFGFKFLGCKGCDGFCCRGKSGYIWVDKKEIDALVCELKMSFLEFAARYLRKVGYRFSLREKLLEDGDFGCIFFEEELNGCRIYSHRPKQCRTFPFWECFKNNKEVAKECPNIVFY